jgi:hypothetical protein
MENASISTKIHSANYIENIYIHGPDRSQPKSQSTLMAAKEKINKRIQKAHSNVGRWTNNFKNKIELKKHVNYGRR